jgi:hypothetical protein
MRGPREGGSLAKGGNNLGIVGMMVVMEPTPDPFAPAQLSPNPFAPAQLGPVTLATASSKPPPSKA